MGVLPDVRRRGLRGQVQLPEIAEWCREKREKDEAEGVVRTRKRMCWSETRGWTQTARSLISA